eukprot:8632313-Pyramimonas_sp.AAC.1
MATESTNATSDEHEGARGCHASSAARALTPLRCRTDACGATAEPSSGCCPAPTSSSHPPAPAQRHRRAESGEAPPGNA